MGREGCEQDDDEWDDEDDDVVGERTERFEAECLEAGSSFLQVAVKECSKTMDNPRKLVEKGEEYCEVSDWQEHCGLEVWVARRIGSGIHCGG